MRTRKKTEANPPEAEKNPPKPESKKDSASPFLNPLKLDNCVSANFGKRGSGKTVLAEWLIRDFKRVVIFDPRYQIEGKFEIVTDREGFVRAVLKNENEFRILWRPLNPKREFIELCRYLYQTPFEDTMLLVDEVSMVCDPLSIPDDFQNLIRFSRHNRTGIIVTAQRPSNVNRDLTAQATHLFIFRQHEPRDIAYFSGFISETDKIKDLPDYHFLYTDFNSPPVISKIKLDKS